MSHPLLSISIPTYNRAKFLDECLESITSQFTTKEILSDVEIVISDNGSSDNTTEIVEKFKKHFTNIHYYKNSHNLGFDSNLLNVVEKSSGRYCITLGDDDTLFPGSISFLLTTLKKHNNVPYFMLNCWGYDHNMQKPVTANPNRILDSDKSYITLNDFVITIKDYSELVGSFGGISVQLFNREKWLQFKDFDKYIDTQAVHLFVLLSVYKNEKFMIIAKPLVKTRNDNMRWDICPGFETNSKRSASTMKIALWISNLYNLNLSERRMKIYFMKRTYIQSFKQFIKKVLSKLGLRKYR